MSDEERLIGIEKLIEEQKKTQEAIKLLRESDSYDELLKKIPEVELKYDDRIYFNDPWDYEWISSEYDMMAAKYIKKAVESFGRAKYCLEYVKRFYEGRIKEWEDCREKCKSLVGKNKHRGDWKKMYSNPVCLKFFEDYEKAHGIKDSIYQEMKNEQDR